MKVLAFHIQQIRHISYVVVYVYCRTCGIFVPIDHFKVTNGAADDDDYDSFIAVTYPPSPKTQI